MQHFPIFMVLEQRACLVVGGGRAAARKAGLLLRAGAKITVAAPHLDACLTDLQRAGGIDHYAGAITPGLLRKQTLVIAACEDRNSNRWVYEQAQRCNIPVNVVDDPDLCTFIMPAIVDRAPLTIAISSGGNAPLLARTVRARLEALLPTGYGRLARIAGELRERVKQRLPAGDSRRRFWEAVFEGPLSEQLMNLESEQGNALLERELARASAQTNTRPGLIALIGAGSGDADLLTLRAQRLLQQADSVIYPPGVSEQVLDRARRDAAFVEIKHHQKQELALQLTGLAGRGQQVCWLEPGRPAPCARITRTLRALAQSDSAVQIVPGVEAGVYLGAASYPRISPVRQAQ